MGQNVEWKNADWDKRPKIKNINWEKTSKSKKTLEKT
jgi:hypothetical protein